MLRGKRAYPNYDDFIPHSAPRDTQEWMEAAKSIYYLVHQGLDMTTAKQQVLANWDEVKKREFGYWLRFYEENGHNKYGSLKGNMVKRAQISFLDELNRPGYYLPHKFDEVKTQETHPDIRAQEKRALIEKQRSKVISRLDSIEKLLRSQDGQLFADKEYENLIHIIYELKKKIQTVNKVSLSNRTYQDLIIREANILTKKGFAGAGRFLVKLADEGLPSLSPPASANPLQSGGVPGAGQGVGLDPQGNNTPDLTVQSPNATPSSNPESLSKGMEGFLKGLEVGKAVHNADNLEVNDNFSSEDEDLIVRAQVAEPAPASQTTKPETTDKLPEGDLEVKQEVHVKDFDNLVDKAFENLTVSDVVSKLENLTKIFKVREVPRQLAMVDMMLDSLGLASMFPTLAEAMNKALDSNQYIGSRIDDVLSRLKGSLDTAKIDLTSESPVSPQAVHIKQQLQNEDDKEEKRKKMRKEQEQAELESSLTPEVPQEPVQVKEDLAGPAEIAPLPKPTVPKV